MPRKLLLLFFVICLTTQNTKAYTIRSGDTLWDLSLKNNITLQTLYDANPGVSAFNIRVGQKIIIPGLKEENITTTTAAPSGSKSAKQVQIYRVRNGDSLWAISQKFGLTLEELIAFNKNVQPYRLRVGQKIYLSDPPPEKITTKSIKPVSIRNYTVQSGDTLWAISQRYETTVDELLKLNPEIVEFKIEIDQIIKVPSNGEEEIPTSAKPQVYKKYVIKEGDTLWALSQKYGITVKNIEDANPGVKAYNLKIGDTLNIPTDDDTPEEGDAKPKVFLINETMTEDEFIRSLTENGFSKPPENYYEIIVLNANPKGYISSKLELAMFLAEIYHESVGLEIKKEITPTGPYGKYYGRGFIQLTWEDNYVQASKDLYGDERLKEDPDLVLRDDMVAWDVTFWYWRKRVHPAAGVAKGKFGAATRAINGALECGKGPNDLAEARFNIFAVIFEIFNLPGTPNPDGCY